MSETGTAVISTLRGNTGVLPYNSQIEAVHMSLLHTGKIVYYSGLRQPVRMKTETRIWDPEAVAGVGSSITDPLTPSDIFCAGHVFLPDGRLLSTGGTMEYRRVPPPWLVKFSLWVRQYIPLPIQIKLSERQQMEFTGPRFLYAFDPEKEQWGFAGFMNKGRWYPTNCMLPDGRMLILSGRDEGGGYQRHLDSDAKGKEGEPDYPGRVRINKDVEVLYPNGSLEQKGQVKGPGIRPGMEMVTYGGHHHMFPTEYPRLHVLPLTHMPDQGLEQYSRGRVFCSGYGPETKMLNLGTWEWEHVDDLLAEHPRHDGNSVLLPLDCRDNYRARVLTFCGSRETALKAVALNTCEIIDFSEQYPTWKFLRDPGTGEIVHVKPRVNGAAILLPDGKVMAVGGNSQARWDKPVYDVEIFDPQTNRWERDHRPIDVERGYHATAILLPDARVLISGTSPASHQELRIEVYLPYYLDGNPRRPVIREIQGAGNAPDGEKSQIAYGKPFHVYCEQGDSAVIRCALVRPGSMTHAFDMDQRHIWVEIADTGVDRLTINAPPDPHVAPPGYYMLFLLDEAGVPSEATFLHLPVIEI